jgi:probable rRNA maturation factor
MRDTNISFHYLTPVSSLRQRQQLKVFLQALAKSERKRIDHINYIFCTDEYLLTINQQYLQHDTYTDIVTFELNAPGDPLLSDIYISMDRVRENAKTYHVSSAQELCRVMFHGVLHLCGYKDKSKAEKEMMRIKEKYYLDKYMFHVKQKGGKL